MRRLRLFVVQWAAALVPPCRSQGPAHPCVAALPGRLRHGLKSMERESPADGETAGPLVRGSSEDQEQPPLGPVRTADRTTAFCWKQQPQGAVGFAIAVGAAQRGNEEGAKQNAEYTILRTSASARRGCTTHMGASPGMHRTCAVPARCNQGPRWEPHLPSSPHSSDALPITYATLLGAPPYPLRPPAGTPPVSGAVRQAGRQHQPARPVVHPGPNPP